ncbi:hypothetical protein CY35_16G100700 [Sphagnum magellanicum]|nr:hypothetical protein CY35_16G100700 [Sphagnum magellanicum]
MGTPAFPNLGQHCSVSDCQQIDFLPFSCDACNKVFCLEHRTYANHKCTKANDQDVTVLVCPICSQSVRSVPNEDPNVTWEHHVQTNCNPSNYAKANKKPRCPVPGCKEILVFSNKVLCNSCKREVCLKHRFGPDHNCDAYRKLTENNRSLSSFGSKFLNGFKDRTSFGSGAQSKNVSKGSSSMQLGAFSGVLTGLQSAASSVRTSMETGMSRLSESTSDFFNKVQQNSGTETYHPPQQSRVQTSPREECPQCQAKFATVAQLIQHVESFHASEPSGEVLDVCPKCGKGFQNPIILVNHVERDHGGKS